jgi:hypothetical protein
MDEIVTRVVAIVILVVVLAFAIGYAGARLEDIAICKMNGYDDAQLVGGQRICYRVSSNGELEWATIGVVVIE